MKNILHITPDFNYSCGRSKLVYLYLKYFSSKKDYQSHFITNGGDSLERLNVISNLKFEIMNFSTGIKNLYHVRSFYKNIKEYIFDNKISLIHTHHRFPELIANQVVDGVNAKTIFSTHGFVKGFKGISFKSDRIISVSNSVTDYLTGKYHINPEKVTTLYNPAEKYQPTNDEEIMLLKKKHSIPLNKSVILFMGRINNSKGYDVLIKAFKIVHLKLKDTILLLSGNDESRKIHYKSSSIDSHIKILKPNSESYKLYSIANILVLPSRSDSFPFVMIESGLFKKPFIGGNTGGIAEFIEDGINGLLVDPENPQVLAEKIIYLLNNQQIGRTMGEKLYEKVNRLCDYNNYFSEVEKIYNSLLKE